MILNRLSRKIWPLLLGFCLAGCIAEYLPPTPTLSHNMNKEVFLDKFCGVSCWLGIRIGETTIEDANILLSRNFDNDHIRWKREESNYDWQLNPSLHGGITIKEDIVYIMRFSAGESLISLSDFIDKFGNPDSYALIERASGDCPVYLDALFFYHEYGIVLTSITCLDAKHFTLKRTLPITFVYVLPSNSIEKDISSIYAYDLGDSTTDITEFEVQISEKEVIN